MKAVDDPRIIPGCRVLAYDYRLFVNDKSTPARTLMKPATVMARYGYWCDYGSGRVLYPDLVDVKFDHRELESRGHFTDGIEVIKEAEDGIE